MTPTPRTWPAHALGFALCVAAFVFGYALLLSFGFGSHDSLVAPLWGAMMLFPVTFLVGILCLVLGVFAREFQNRALMIVTGYALAAGYWDVLAVLMRDFEL